MLREAMFLNGVHFNSEDWHNISSTNITQLEYVDNQLLRFIVSGHAKVPVEFLFLETRSKPIRFVITSRRLNYLKQIWDREDSELIKRLYKAQQSSPGDWCEQVNKDLNRFEIETNEDQIKAMKVKEF